MSGNINDTNVDLITTQVYSLIDDLQTNRNTCIQKLEKKYNHLWRTSKTLFNFIVKNVNSSSFDKEYFHKTINLMLGSIRSIQEKKSSQHDASVLVGSHLAQSFIPQLKNTKK